MTAVMTEQDIYATQFSEIAGRLPGRGLAWVDRLRKSAIEQFLELGLPTTRLEDWRFTNVAPIRRLTFRPVNQPNAVVPEPVRSQLDLFPSPRLVFVDGLLDRRLSGLLPEAGLHVAGLSDSLADPNQAAILESHLGRYAETSDRAFTAWNTGFFADGGCVMVSPGTVVSRPVHLVFISTGAGEPRATYPRNLILAGERSQVALVEVFLSASGGVYLTNAVTEIVAGAGAMIDYYKMECESSDGFHVATVKASLGRDASLRSHSISFGAGLARNDLRVALDGEGSQCILNGLFVVDGQRLVDNHTEIDHRKPHTGSRELYKGILAGQAQGVFNGSIIVRKDAQKTNALQHSRNLLLSENTQINTKPQLEIRADDVRCAHGATIGQLDREAMFYLRSRGLDERAARQILIRGFAAEILEGIRVSSTRQQSEIRLDEWFKGKLEAS
ncbi:MAG TPA: Fe-S cluster assembly protein SufD [Terriglobia bacterium]|nr:Fe-S cluster assembly protein SufD [Terriglobia bacterium]